MAFPEIYIDSAVHKRAEFQIRLIEKLCEHFPVEIIQIQDPDLTPERLHILNDLIGLLLPDRKLVLTIPNCFTISINAFTAKV